MKRVKSELRCRYDGHETRFYESITGTHLDQHEPYTVATLTPTTNDSDDQQNRAEQLTNTTSATNRARRWNERAMEADAGADEDEDNERCNYVAPRERLADGVLN